MWYPIEMKHFGVIYKIYNNFDSKVYVGQTTRLLDRRWKQHLYSVKKNLDSFHIHRAMKAHGIENFQIEQIDTAQSREELNSKEIYWINFYDSVKNGYNLNINGHNAFLSDETKEKKSVKSQAMWLKTGHKENHAKKMSAIWSNPEYKHNFSEKMLKNYKNPEFKEKHLQAIKASITPKRIQKTSEASKKMWQDPKYKEKVFKARQIAVQNPIYKEKHSKMLKNRWAIEEYKERTKKNMRKAIQEYHKKPFEVFKIEQNKTMTKINVWENQSTCARDLNLNQSLVWAVLNGKRKSHKGYFFKYI